MEQLTKDMLKLGQFASAFVNQYIDDASYGKGFDFTVGLVMHNKSSRRVYAFVGPSRSGKSTILRVLQGLFKNRSDVQFIEDCDILRFNPEPNTTYFVTANGSCHNMRVFGYLSAINEDLRKQVELVYTKEGTLPDGLYDLFSKNAEAFGGYYGLVCDQSFYEHFQGARDEEKTSQLEQIDAIIKNAIEKKGD